MLGERQLMRMRSSQAWRRIDPTFSYHERVAFLTAREANITLPADWRDQLAGIENDKPDVANNRIEALLQ